MEFCDPIYTKMWRPSRSKATFLLFAFVWAYLILATTTMVKTSPSADARAVADTSSNSSRMYSISIWKVGERMKRRFVRSFGSVELDPFEYCSVRNCRLVTNDSQVEQSDAVMFHLHLLKDLKANLPRRPDPQQLWIFFTDESPYHTFMADRSMTMKALNGLFNLSMTYRSDSDIPVPYGRTERLQTPNEENYTAIVLQKTRNITILGSNCGSKNRRWVYVRELQKYIEVDIYGGCGKPACPGHFTKDCDVIKDYRFYLAFENSNCDEYLTEKLWYNAYSKYAIPVVMGGTRENYERLCPPNSFIHVEDFDSPQSLADYLRELLNDPDQMLAYHEWRKNYRVVNEHGYFGSPSLHLCRMCEAIQKPRRQQVLDRLEQWWSVKRDCRKSLF